MLERTKNNSKEAAIIQICLSQSSNLKYWELIKQEEPFFFPLMCNTSKLFKSPSSEFGVGQYSYSMQIGGKEIQNCASKATNVPFSKDIFTVK